MPSVSIPKDDGEVVGVTRPDGTEFSRTVSNGRIRVDDDRDLYLVLSQIEGASLASNPDASSKDK